MSSTGDSAELARGSTAAARARTETLLQTLLPHVVVTEKLLSTSRKGPRSAAMIEAAARVAAEADLIDVSIVRPRPCRDRYAEAAALVMLYPDMAPKVPARRRFWESDPWALAYFDALALVRAAQVGPGAVTL